MFTGTMYMLLLFGGQLFLLSALGLALTTTAGMVTGTPENFHKIKLWVTQTFIISAGIILLAATLWGTYEAGAWLLQKYMF
ncbi:hypothetical protein ACTFR8_24455 [Bacillus cereus group sp. MYBK15-3]|uniref:hypothetical protein n=1 Tax=unclassified Bacillus cereus group TaxID=2750818 RepID=UPI003F7AEFCB